MTTFIVRASFLVVNTPKVPNTMLRLGTMAKFTTSKGDPAATFVESRLGCLVRIDQVVLDRNQKLVTQRVQEREIFTRCYL